MDSDDDGFFGKMLKKNKNKLKSAESRIELDDDDPLADLLGGLSDEDDVKQKSKPDKRSVGRTLSRVVVDDKDNSDAALILPESPRMTTRKPRNMIDDLLAKSDVVQVRDTAPVQRDFILGENYRSFAGHELGNGDQHSNDSKESSFATNLGVNTRITGISNSMIGNDNRVEAGGVSRQVSLPTGRIGRRGISPTIESTIDANVDVKRPPTSADVPTPIVSSEKKFDSSWLELKNDVPTTGRRGVTTSATTSTLNNETLKPQIQNHFENANTSMNSTKNDWLKNNNDFDNITKPVLAQDQAQTVDPKKNSFMNWLDKAKPSEPDAQGESPLSVNAVPNRVQAVPEVNVHAIVPALESGQEIFKLTTDYEERLSTFRTKMAEAHLKFSEESLNAAGNILNLQTKVRRLEFDRDQLQRSLEGLEKRHREELDTLENSFKRRVQLTEESYQRREQRLQEELESFTKAQIEKQNSVDKDRAELLITWQRKLDEATEDRMKDLELLKSLHGRTLADMKRDHEVAIGRLQKIKAIEVDAMSEATSHTRTLRAVIEQLRSNTTELGNLQLKVEGGHVSSLEERELLLETKDRQLKAVQDQLQKQRDQNEQERTLLRQLIMRLEEKLQQQTVVQEEERWKLSQERNKLETEQNLLEESRKATSVQMDKEKTQLEKAREQFLAEQKEILQHVYNENQRLLSLASGNTSDPATKYFNNKLPTDVSNSLHSLKAEIEAEMTLKSMHDERKRLDDQTAILDRERQSLQTQKLQLKLERSAINELAMQVKLRSEEVEEMCLSAAQTREEGYSSLQEAKRLHREIHQRKDSITKQMEAIKNKECQLAKERLTLGRQRAELEKLSSSRLLCFRCGSLNDVSRTTPSVSNINGNESIVVRNLEPVLVSWQIAARKDDNFLNRENVFLKNLRTNRGSTFLETQ